MLKEDVKIMVAIHELLDSIEFYGISYSFSRIVELTLTGKNIRLDVEELIMNLSSEYQVLFVIHPLFSEEIGLFSNKNAIDLFISMSKSITKLWTGDELKEISLVTLLKKFNLYDISMKNLFSLEYIDLANIDNRDCKILLKRLFTVRSHIFSKLNLSPEGQYRINFTDTDLLNVKDMVVKFKDANDLFGTRGSQYGSEFISIIEYGGIFKKYNVEESRVIGYDGDIKKLLFHEFKHIIDKLDAFMMGHELYYSVSTEDLEYDYYYDIRELASILELDKVYTPDLFEQDYHVVNDLREQLQTTVKICQLQKLLKETLYTCLHIRDVGRVLDVVAECILVGVCNMWICDFEEVIRYDINRASYQ